MVQKYMYKTLVIYTRKSKQITLQPVAFQISMLFPCAEIHTLSGHGQGLCLGNLEKTRKTKGVINTTPGVGGFIVR